MLYIVSTPIGNLKDITYRAVETLKSVDLIAAEDTRHSKILLDAYEISKPLTSFFTHNEAGKTDYLIGLLKQGKNIALISDAGTPGISDPGYALIEAARVAGIEMSVIPGVTAVITALTLSGLPAHLFEFQGFLPVKSGARQKAIEAWKEAKGTVICYESPHRLLKALKDMDEILGESPVVVARELTKMFEEIRRDTAANHIKHFTQHPPKGEFVLLYNPSLG